MLDSLALILFVAWLLALASSFTASPWIHGFLIAAIAVAALSVARRRQSGR